MVNLAKKDKEQVNVVYGTVAINNNVNYSFCRKLMRDSFTIDDSDHLLQLYQSHLLTK